MDVKAEMRRIQDSGWEVGLHGGHDAPFNPDRLKKEKERLEGALGSEITGYRSHYIKFKLPETWTYLEEAGFKYDCTVGFADCIGFRNGMCHPYKPFNLNADKFLNITEIPLVVGDLTPLAVMGLDSESSLRIIKILIDSVKKVNGVLTILWHNNILFDEMHKGLYREILSYSQNQNAWITSCHEVWNWYEDNEYFSGV
jgi:peptidoglycan/xylan/chitin deacetylase (PgdA/CDA1 family)